MNFFLSLVIIALLLLFLTARMYRSFGVGLGLFVGFWSDLNMGWSPVVSISLFFITWLFVEYIFDDRIRANR